jgi:hypothetical protein
MALLENALLQDLDHCYPKGGLEENILERLTAGFLHGLSHIFNHYLAIVTQTQNLIIGRQADLRYEPPGIVSLDLGSAIQLATQSATSLMPVMNGMGAKYLLVHFDETQNWTTNQLEREGARFVPPQDFRNYLLLALTDAMMIFKPFSIRFALTGTDVTQSHYLRLSSQMKICRILLPVFSETAVLEALNQMCNLQHLDDQQLRRTVVARLAGCPRNVEYFLRALLKYQDWPPAAVTMDILHEVCCCCLTLLIFF